MEQIPEKLTGPRLVKKFTAFHGTPGFITVSMSTSHMTLA